MNATISTDYHTHTLPNGLRIIALPTNSPVSYCGLAVRAGTRNEQAGEFGLAHFIEHMLFKGTDKRRAWHILNRMERVGGELNAYTTQEETIVYSICLDKDLDRAVDLLADLVFHSRFPEAEIDKEREVVLDEIRSYEDNPAELIADEFENLLFRGSSLGHSILGCEEHLNTFTSATCRRFTEAFYRPDNMVFFVYGQSPFRRILRLAERYMATAAIATPAGIDNEQTLLPPSTEPGRHLRIDKSLHQTHVMIGSRGYHLHHPKRLGLYLLNNILGGPGMNSRLNISLREKRGLVYTVESALTSYSDTGMFDIYFGCDAESLDTCLRLTYRELKRLRETRLSTSQFHAAVKQLKGQMGIAADNKENIALGMGKSFLHFNRYDTLPEICRKIDALSPGQLLDIANEVWAEERLHSLVFE